MNHEMEVRPWAWDKYAAREMTAFLDLEGLDGRNVQRGDSITLTKRRGVDRLQYVVTYVERVGCRVPVANSCADVWVGSVLHLAPDTGVEVDDDA